MAEVEATMSQTSLLADAPENSETIEAPPAIEAPAAQEPAPEPKRGRGRPAGAKDKAPRAAKPKVRVEPIPAPVEPKAKPAPKPAQAPQAGDLPSIPPPVVEERPPSPEPPSPRTLFRQTSAHLLNLRDVMNSQKRASVAERYTSKLHTWPVV